MEITPHALNALYTAVSAAFNQGRGTYTPTGDRIATTIPSTTAQNDYSWMGEFSRLREWIGERQINKAKVHSYAIKNKKFEATEGIKAEYIEDDQYGILMPKFQDMGYASATHPDELLYALLAAGFTTPCFDGQNYFDTDHPVGEEGQEVSVSNMQAGAGNAWYVLDTRRPIKPLIKQLRRDYRLQAKTDAGNSDHVFMRDEYLYGVDARLNVGFGFWQMAFASKADLTDENLDAAVAAMMGFKSDKGRPLGVMPDLLVCGPSNRAKARKIIEAAQKVGGESNTNYKALDLLVVPWLA